MRAIWIIFPALAIGAQSQEQAVDLENASIVRRAGYVAVLKNDKWAEDQGGKRGQGATQASNHVSLYGKDGALLARAFPRGGSITSASVSAAGNLLVAMTPSCYPEHSYCGPDYRPEPAGQLFDPQGKPLREFAISGSRLALSPNGKFAMVSSAAFGEEAFQVVDTRAGDEIKGLKWSGFDAYAAEFTNDNRIAAVVSERLDKAAPYSSVHLQLWEPDLEKHPKGTPIKSREVRPSVQNQGYDLSPQTVLAKSPENRIFATALRLTRVSDAKQEQLEDLPRHLLVFNADLGILHQATFAQPIRSLKFEDENTLVILADAKDVPPGQAKNGQYYTGFEIHVLDLAGKAVIAKTWVPSHELEDVYDRDGDLQIIAGRGPHRKIKSFQKASKAFSDLPQGDAILIKGKLGTLKAK